MAMLSDQLPQHIDQAAAVGRSNVGKFCSGLPGPDDAALPKENSPCKSKDCAF
jgi:hypothetical protein